MKMKIILVAASLALFGAGCGAPPASDYVRPSPLSGAMLQNLTYDFGWTFGLRKVELKDGYAETYPAEGIGPDESIKGYVRMDPVIGRGDLDGDGSEDAIVVLRVNSGGTGVWPDVFVVLNKKAGPEIHANALAFLELEDRAQIRSIAVRDGNVSMDMTVHGPRDPMCCPTLNKKEAYRWTGNFLETVPESTAK